MCKDDQKVVSVIMAAYNAEKTVEVAVHSILQQTYGNFELIICDDASTDKTWKILTQIAKDNPCIRLIHQDVNRGAAAARNRCLEQARGKFIAIMGADDVSFPSRLELQLNYLCINPSVSFVGSRGEFFSEKPGDLKKYYVVINGNDPMREARQTFSRTHLKFNYPNGAQTLISLLENTLDMDENEGEKL